MLLTRTLTIANTEYRVIDERITLGLNQAGRAIFTLENDGAGLVKHQPIAFDIGYASHDSSQRLFLGYIESITPIDGKRVSLFCRELANLLALSVPISLRHPTISDVLQEVSKATQLHFYSEDNGAKIAHFYNVGNGYRALEGLAAAFKIEDFIWQQQGNGVVYAGSWPRSRWHDKAITVDGRYFEQHLSSRSVVMAAVPALRPGVVMNGQRITQLRFSGNKMTVVW